MIKGKKLRYERLIFVIAVFLLFSFGISRILGSGDPYKALKEVSNQTKLAGEQKEQFNEENEEQLRFLHYPQFESESMNTKINEYIKKLPQENGITFLDYESNSLNDRYVSVKFHYQLLDKEQKPLKEDYQYISFDLEANREIRLQDIFRGNYVDLISEEFQKQANKKITAPDKAVISLDEEVVHVHCDNASVKLKYSDYQKYIKLAGKGTNKKPLEVKRKLKIDPKKPMIALTFDDGPSPYTDEVMKVFEEHQANASFFMLGQNIQNYPDTVKHMVENGFEICNHSWDHKSIESDDRQHIRKEVFDTQDVLYELTGHEAVYVRPPYGAWNDTTKQVLNQNGLQVALWNVDSEDWKNRDKQITLERAKAGEFDGAMILFHDLYPTTLEAVKELVPYLQSKGYQLVTVSELFKYKSEKTGL